MRLAETAAPGFSALVEYRELSTPLTVEHFTSHPGGRFYGLPTRPARYRSSPLGALTPVPGLYLAGADVASLGIIGAMMGGVAAASHVLGPLGFLRIMAKAGRPKAQTLARTRSPEKQRARLIAKTALTPSVWRLDFELDQPMRFAPGQFVKLRVAEFEWRDYSIAAAAGARLTLLVSNRTHGDGSDFADAAEPGAETEIEGPFGAYHLQPKGRRKVFVATGTGLAPFLPMFETMARGGELDSAELYFGCRTSAEDITTAFACRPKRTVACVSREPASPGGFCGRVTKALAGLGFDPAADGVLRLRLRRYGRRLPDDSGARRRAPDPDRALLSDRRGSVWKNPGSPRPKPSCCTRSSRVSTGWRESACSTPKASATPSS